MRVEAGRGGFGRWPRPACWTGGYESCGGRKRAWTSLSTSWPIRGKDFSSLLLMAVTSGCWSWQDPAGALNASERASWLSKASRHWRSAGSVGRGRARAFAKSRWRPSPAPSTSFNVGERDASEFLAFPRELKQPCSPRCTTRAWTQSSRCRPPHGSGATSVQAVTERITRIARPGRGRGVHYLSFRWTTRGLPRSLTAGPSPSAAGTNSANGPSLTSFRQQRFPWRPPEPTCC